MPERRIADLFGEEEVTVEGTVVSLSSRRTARRLTIQKATVRDASGSIPAVWFNQPWLVERLPPGTRVRLRGQLRRGELSVRSYDAGGDASATADYAPVYPATEDVPPQQLRELVEAALPLARGLPDPLPAALRERERLPARADARARAAPAARDAGEAEVARAASRSTSCSCSRSASPAAPGSASTPSRRRSASPASSSRGCAARSRSRSRRTRRARSASSTPTSRGAVPMQRLLQGDVGSGKTVVALYALLRAVEAGRQGALMAPTETLAEQHFLTVEGLCAELGVRVRPADERAAARASSGGARDAIASGEAQLAVGTHALIQEEVEFRDLAVAVVDEQHRFGVEQRARSPRAARRTSCT